MPTWVLNEVKDLESKISKTNDKKMKDFYESQKQMLENTFGLVSNP